MRLRSWTLAILLVSLASIARAAEPVDAGVEAELSGDWDGHVVVADATVAIDPASACEAGSADRPTTRPAVRHVESHEMKSTSSEAAPIADAAEPPPKSLAARQGLLVPAAFLAAASALSGTIVLGLRGRVAGPATQLHADVLAPADSALAKPSTH